MVRLKQIKDKASPPTEVLDVILKRRAPRKKNTNQSLLANAAEKESSCRKSQSYNAQEESRSQISYNVSAVEKERSGHASPSVFDDDSFDEDFF